MDKIKILIFIEWTYPSNEKNFLSLYKEIKKYFKKITVAVFSNSMYRKNKTGFPGIDEKFKTDKDFVNADVVWLNNKREIYKLIKKKDLIILGNCRGETNNIIIFSRIRGKIVVIHNDPANYDLGDVSPNLYCVENKINQSLIKHKFNLKKINKISKLDICKVTGSLQYDKIFKHEHNDKQYFYKKYDLQKKPFVIFMPSGPQTMAKYYQQDYKKIYDQLKKKYEVLIKIHPSDFYKRKTIYYNKNKFSYEVILKNKKVKILDPNDFENGLKFCDMVFSIDTTGFIPVNMSKKPIIYIDRFKYLGENIKKTKHFIKNNYYNKSVDTRNFVPKSLLSEIEKKGLSLSATSRNFQHKKHIKNFLYFGCDLSYDNFLKINLRKLNKKFPKKLAKKLGYQVDNKTSIRITKEIILYLKNYNPNLKSKLEIYQNLFIYILKNFNKKIKYKLKQISIF